MKILALLLCVSLLGCLSCGNDSTDRQKLVSIGDSITMGIQDGGLVKDYQLSSYPSLIARQLGIDGDFQQPLVSSPGFGIPPYKIPLQFRDDRIIAEYIEGGIENIDRGAMLQQILPLLENLSLERPYDNLGVGGARLYDVRNTTNHSDAVLLDNFFFDIVLRNFNPSFEGGTVLEQAIDLDPSIIMLWIGSNDILGAVLAGGDESLITDTTDFREEFSLLLSELGENTDATILIANIPGYLSFGYALDDIFKIVDGFPSDSVPVLFDYETYQPIDFGAGEYIPLITEEDSVKYLLIPGVILSIEEGTGIPDKDFLMKQLGYTPTEADDLITDMGEAGLNLQGQGVGEPLSGDLTITVSEELVIIDALGEFNAIIRDLSNEFGVPLVDINRLWDPDEEGAFGGYSGEFVLDDPVNTIFSLDGVHPNNLGHAIIANAFIDRINESLGLGIPQLNTEDYKDQYAHISGHLMRRQSLEAVEAVQDFFLLR